MGSGLRRTRGDDQSGPKNVAYLNAFKPGDFDVQGIVPAAYALFAMALGIAAGAPRVRGQVEPSVTEREVLRTRPAARIPSAEPGRIAAKTVLPAGWGPPLCPGGRPELDYWMGMELELTGRPPAS